jgi:hypothetical protein
MPEALACPNCSAPLPLSNAAGDPPVVTCRYCESQVMVCELFAEAPVEERRTINDRRPPPPPQPSPQNPKVDPRAALEQVARLARNGDRQAAIKLYRESQDSSSQEAQGVVALLSLDQEIQPDWAVERVQRELRSRRAPEVGKEQPKRGNWVVYAMLVLLALALLIPLLVSLLSS